MKILDLLPMGTLSLYPVLVELAKERSVTKETTIYKIDNVLEIQNFLNPEGHQNRITGSKVTTILVKR